jgi:hypothetical protein
MTPTEGAAKDPAKCRHQPAPDTIYTTTGPKGTLSRPMDYPLDAVCLLCGEPIRCQSYYPITDGGDWRPKYP